MKDANRVGAVESGFYVHPHSDVLVFQKAPEVFLSCPEIGFPLPGRMEA